MSAPAAATSDAPAAAPAVSPAAAEPVAASSSTAAPASSPAPAAAPASGPVPLSGTDSLTKLMIDKSLSMLASHKAISSRGVGMLLRNLYGILFGPMFSQSWENQLTREEQKSGRIGMAKTNETSLKRLAHFFTNKKVRAKSGASLALALCNPTAQRESFEHRLTLIWLGAAGSSRLFKIDGMKRSGILGLTTAQTSWPVICTEVSDPSALWAALQSFIPRAGANPKEEWSKEKAAAWDAIVAQEPVSAANPAAAAADAAAATPAAASSSSAAALPSIPSRNVAFGSRLDLKGPQSIVAVTNDEEGLAVDLKNGLVERLKAISLQLDAMPQ